MPRTRPLTPSTTSERDLNELLQGLSASQSAAEDRYWEPVVFAAIDQLLQGNDEATINQTLERLQTSRDPAADVFANALEARVELACDLIPDHDVLLIAAPLLMWSNYRIPTPTLSEQVLEPLRTQFAAHLLARHAKVAMANYLFSPDQLPAGFCPTAALAALMAEAAYTGQSVDVPASELPDSQTFLADTRFLLVVACVPHGQPIFRWQEDFSERDGALQGWYKQGVPLLQPLFAGCHIQATEPGSFFNACRNADMALRPYAVTASVTWLSMALETFPGKLRATVALCEENDQAEYRIGFTYREQNEVMHGVVWPLFGTDEEPGGDSTALTDIERTLHAAGVTDITVIDHSLPLEYCSDCDAPFYPDPNADLVHAELPETPGLGSTSRHLH